MKPEDIEVTVKKAHLEKTAGYKINVRYLIEAQQFVPEYEVELANVDLLSLYVKEMAQQVYDYCQDENYNPYVFSEEVGRLWKERG